MNMMSKCARFHVDIGLHTYLAGHLQCGDLHLFGPDHEVFHSFCSYRKGWADFFCDSSVEDCANTCMFCCPCFLNDW